LLIKKIGFKKIESSLSVFLSHQYIGFIQKQCCSLGEIRLIELEDCAIEDAIYFE